MKLLLALFLVSSLYVKSNQAMNSSNIVVDENNCSQHKVKGDKITVCGTDRASIVVVLPLFKAKFNFEDVKKDAYLNTATKQLDIEVILPDKWVKQVHKLKKFRSKRRVVAASVSKIRFENNYKDYLNYQKFQPKLTVKPCFYFKNNKWIDVEGSARKLTTRLTLIDLKRDKTCFDLINSSELSKVIRATYRLHEFDMTNVHKAPIQFKSSKITIQKHVDGSLSFAKRWNSYVKGFGNPSKNFWIGLEKLHLLTNAHHFKVRFEMKKVGSNKLYYATYNTFRVGSASTQYKLTIAGFNRKRSNFDAEKHNYGMLYNNGMKFSTIDRDNDKWPRHCSKVFGGGGWWYRSCHYVNPNGLYSTTKNSCDKCMTWNAIDKKSYYPLNYSRILLVE